MTDDEKQAIDNFKFFDEGDYITREMAESKDIVLRLIQKQQAELKKYKEMYAVSVADRVNSAFKQEHKNNEDLEMLYKGCQIELEEKDKIIDEMAKHIKTTAIYECPSKDCEDDGSITCEDCIKEHFKNKVETEEK